MFSEKHFSFIRSNPLIKIRFLIKTKAHIDYRQVSMVVEKIRYPKIITNKLIFLFQKASKLYKYNLKFKLTERRSFPV